VHVIFNNRLWCRTKISIIQIINSKLLIGVQQLRWVSFRQLCLQAPVQIRRDTWLDFDEIISGSYEDIGFTRFSGSLPVVTPKNNQHIYEPKYTCDPNSVKFPLSVIEMWSSQGFGSLPAVILSFNLLTPKSIKHICEHKYICSDQNPAKFSSFLRYGVHNIIESLPALTLTFDLLSFVNPKHLW